MEDVFDVLISDSSPADQQLFLLWVGGCTVEEAWKQTMSAFKEVSSRLPLPLLQQSTSSHRRSGCIVEELPGRTSQEGVKSNEEAMILQLLRHEVIDQWRLFEVLEHYLCQPVLMTQQMICQQSLPSLLWLIEKYYYLDAPVARDILGKRLTAKVRKDLDDVAEITGIPIGSCRRQFDNVRRVFASIEDSTTFQCNLHMHIAQIFLLPPPVATRYVCLVFMLYTRFQIQSKRKLQRLEYEDLEYMAAVLFVCLVSDTFAFADCGFGLDTSDPFLCVPYVSGVEVDKSLIASLKDIRQSVVYEKETLEQYVATVKDAYDAKKGYEVLVVSKIKPVIRSLFTIGANLSQMKEFRDVMEDVVVKIVEPLIDLGFNLQDAVILLEIVGRQIPPATVGGVQTYLPVRARDTDWRRFVLAVQFCAQRVYDQIPRGMSA